MGVNNGKFRLHKVNGVIVEVPQEKMSAEDVRYVEKLTRGNNRKSRGPPGPSDDDDLAAKFAEVMYQRQWQRQQEERRYQAVRVLSRRKARFFL